MRTPYGTSLVPSTAGNSGLAVCRHPGTLLCEVSATLGRRLPWLLDIAAWDRVVAVHTTWNLTSGGPTLLPAGSGLLQAAGTRLWDPEKSQLSLPIASSGTLPSMKLGAAVQSLKTSVRTNHQRKIQSSGSGGERRLTSLQRRGPRYKVCSLECSCMRVY